MRLRRFSEQAFGWHGPVADRDGRTSGGLRTAKVEDRISHEERLRRLNAKTRARQKGAFGGGLGLGDVRCAHDRTDGVHRRELRLKNGDFVSVLAGHERGFESGGVTGDENVDGRLKKLERAPVDGVALQGVAHGVLDQTFWRVGAAGEPHLLAQGRSDHRLNLLGGGFRASELHERVMQTAHEPIHRVDKRPVHIKENGAQVCGRERGIHPVP